MERRKFTREFKLEAVRLIKDRGDVVCAGVARPEGASDSAGQLSDPRGAFRGQGQMKPEQLEIARLRCWWCISGRCGCECFCRECL